MRAVLARKAHLSSKRPLYTQSGVTVPDNAAPESPSLIIKVMVAARFYQKCILCVERLGKEMQADMEHAADHGICSTWRLLRVSCRDLSPFKGPA